MLNAEVRGAMVISLDFELIWGVRDIHDSRDPYALRIIQERRMVPLILKLFEEYDVAATWATVGFMFARSRTELEKFNPTTKPQYKDKRLNPYLESLGHGEWDDPLHYAHQLIQQIHQARRQELGTHTFSHYYCLEPGQTDQAFAADLVSAIALAREQGIQIRSIVFPRNQHNPEYDKILLDHGIECYRGTEKHLVYQADGRSSSRLPYKRLYRLVDSHIPLSGSHLTSWGDVVAGSGLCNVAASRYLRPIKNNGILAKMRLKRIAEAMEEAGRDKKIFHLWTHPQDFGAAPEENLQGFKAILDHFKLCQQKYGMLSLSMLETARMAKGISKT